MVTHRDNVYTQGLHKPFHADISTFESHIKALIKFLYIENQENNEKVGHQTLLYSHSRNAQNEPRENKPSNASPLARK